MARAKTADFPANGNRYVNVRESDLCERQRRLSSTSIRRTHLLPWRQAVSPSVHGSFLKTVPARILF